jgi:hypothetical protein
MIQFHSLERTVSITGAECSYGRNYCVRLFASVLGMFDFRLGQQEEEILKRLLPADSFLQGIHPPAAFGRAMVDFLFAFSDRSVLVDPSSGKPLRLSSLILNTALVAGSDPVRLLARLTGQCELHTYVEGPHRAWLADIIKEGLGTGVLRRFGPDVENDHVGWPAVEALLGERDDGPVVVSDSVNPEGFPLLCPWSAMYACPRWRASRGGRG